MVLRDRLRFLIGSIGLAIAVLGFIVFIGQMHRSIRDGRFESVPVRVVLDDKFVRENVPVSLVQWSQRSTNPQAEDVLNWILDEVPLALLLGLVGGVTAWWNLSRPLDAGKR